ncbi:hypothetical protein BBJ28_00017355 [Nothophytophthora sp. Chile5]|nr:hypothetical protein BBJ28_00017355 [Nothophytophthora sp. Chile5]
MASTSGSTGAVPVPPPRPGKAATSSTTTSATFLSHAEQRNRLLDEYLARTGVLQVLQDFVTGLAATFKTQLRLPENPYPALLDAIRVQELRQSFVLHGDSSIDSVLALTVLPGQDRSSSPQFQVYSVENEQLRLPIWGLKSTLEQLNAPNLTGLLELLHSVFQVLMPTREFKDDDCRVSVYDVLVGETIFGTGPEQQAPSILELETHVFVQAAQIEKAMEVFARLLLKQLHEASSAATSFASLSPEKAVEYCGCVASGGICITTRSSVTDAADSSEWTIEHVAEKRSGFISAVKTALVLGSQIALTRFYCVKPRQSDDRQLCEIVQTCFFHFAAQAEDKKATWNHKAGSKSAPSQQSFLLGSRALTSGIHFSDQGALKLAERFQAETQTQVQAEDRKKPPPKKTQVTAVGTQRALPPSNLRSRVGFAGIWQHSIAQLQCLASTSSTFRLYVNRLVNCFATGLGHLVEAHQMLERILLRSGGRVAILTLIRASFSVLQRRMDRFLDECRGSPPSSVLHPVHQLLCQYYGQVQANSTLGDDREIEEFVEALRQVNELLLIIVRIVFDDFLRLVDATRSPHTSATATTASNRQEATALEEIDVLRELETAVEQRKYPSVILSEAVFAQFLVDSCLDVALESAVIDCVAICHPPNPFISISSHLQAFAIRQLVWQHPLTVSSSSLVVKCGRGPETLPLFAIAGSNPVISSNSTLLQLVDSNDVLETHRWLLNHRFLHAGDYTPAKSSYSAAIFANLLLFRPLAFARVPPLDNETSSIFREVDLLEHYILRGAEALQARAFFVDVVRKDLQRIVSACGSSSSGSGNNCYQIHTEVKIVDSHGKSVTSVDLSSSTTDELLDQIIQEATQAQCLIQVTVSCVETTIRGSSRPLVIHQVSKSYVFHYQSSDNAESSTTVARWSPLLSFRLLEYGIFFSMENALVCLQRIHESVSAGNDASEWRCTVPRNEWTPYAAQALRLGDALLLYELETAHEHANRVSTSQDLRIRLVSHSQILQLFALERAIEWLLQFLRQTASSDKAGALVSSLQHRVAGQILTEMEQLVVPMNRQLQLLHPLSEHLESLRDQITRWQATLPPPEEQLELQRHQPAQSPFTPRETPLTITQELVASLRTTWTLVLFFRFSYQRAFFANRESA